MRDPKVFRIRLRELLDERGLKIADLARGTGVSYTTAWHWVKPNGRRKTPYPSLDSIAKIAEFLSISLPCLLNCKTHHLCTEILDVASTARSETEKSHGVRIRLANRNSLSCQELP